MAIDDSYVAFCLDEAVAEYGTFIVSELKQVKGKTEKQIAAKQAGKLQYLLTGDKKKMYADPGAKMRR